MTTTIPNDKAPKYATRDPFAEFRIVLRRDGDRIRLDIPAPRVFRDFHNFTGREKDAYHAILHHLVENAGDALRKAVTP